MFTSLLNVIIIIYDIIITFLRQLFCTFVNKNFKSLKMTNLGRTNLYMSVGW